MSDTITPAEIGLAAFVATLFLVTFLVDWIRGIRPWKDRVPCDCFACRTMRRLEDKP